MRDLRSPRFCYLRASWDAPCGSQRMSILTSKALDTRVVPGGSLCLGVCLGSTSGPGEQVLCVDRSAHAHTHVGPRGLPLDLGAQRGLIICLTEAWARPQLVGCEPPYSATQKTKRLCGEQGWHCPPSDCFLGEEKKQARDPWRNGITYSQFPSNQQTLTVIDPAPLPRKPCSGGETQK